MRSDTDPCELTPAEFSAHDPTKMSCAPSRTVMIRIAMVAATLLLLDLSGPALAQAYLDPMTGSVVLQALVGGALGGIYFLRRHWRGFMTRIGLRSEDRSAPDDTK